MYKSILSRYYGLKAGDKISNLGNSNLPSGKWFKSSSTCLECGMFSYFCARHFSYHNPLAKWVCALCYNMNA